MLRSDGTDLGTFRDVFKGQVNTEHERIYRNIRANIRRQLPQLERHPPNDYKVALLCGGPSLAKAKIPRGYKIATVNGTHDWALDHGLKPSVFAMIDARPHNVRFVERAIPTCRYLLQSQVDPGVFDALEEHDVRIFHASAEPEKRILDRYYLGRWLNVPGGSSVGTRAIGLLYLLGVRTLRVYGMDSCLAKGKHHAYAQPENDRDGIRVVRVGRRRFQVHTWMLAQTDEMVQFLATLPDDLKLSIEGDGLLAYLINETAKRGRPPRVVLES